MRQTSCISLEGKRRDNDKHLRLYEKKKDDKVVKSLERTNNDSVEYETGYKLIWNNIVSYFSIDFTTIIQS